MIGLGTWRAFDVDLSADVRRQLADVLSLFVKLGGRVIDSSPMYGRAEEVIGDLTSAPGIREKLFLATKVWTKGKQSGIQSMERSMSLLRTNRIDLMQVHNLVDVNTQLATLQEWKQQGRIRYTGITHYESGSFERNRKTYAEPEVRFPPDQLFADGTRSRATRSAVGAGARRRRDRESAIRIRRSVRQSAFETAAGLGGGI